MNALLDLCLFSLSRKRSILMGAKELQELSLTMP